MFIGNIAKLDNNGENKRNPFEILFGMRREAPEFIRCCFCLPLRRGLIGWGYVKLALDMMAFGLMVFLTACLGVIPGVLVEMIILMTDAAFNVLLVVGSHQRNMKFLKITYVYSLVWLGLALLSFCWLAYIDISLAIQMVSMQAHYSIILGIILPGFCVQIAIFFVHVYLVLLIRSLMVKLQNQTVEFQFTNPSADVAQCPPHNPSAIEAQCTLLNQSVTEPSREEKPGTSVECTMSKYLKL